VWRRFVPAGAHASVESVPTRDNKTLVLSGTMRIGPEPKADRLHRRRVPKMGRLGQSYWDNVKQAKGVRCRPAHARSSSAASQRDDLCLTPPPNVKGAASHKVTQRLITAGLVKEVMAEAGAPVCRRDAENHSYALTLTPFGLTAIGLDQIERQNTPEDLSTTGDVDRLTPSATLETGRRTPTGSSKEGSHEDAHPCSVAAASKQPAQIRAGSKIAQVMELLRREEGATLAEMIAATSWLAHSTRAALTGLRKRGYQLERTRTEGITRYRFPNDPVTDRPRGGPEADESVERFRSERETA
jgi:Protein of unknown function (DUF3489)